MSWLSNPRAVSPQSTVLCMCGHVKRTQHPMSCDFSGLILLVGSLSNFRWRCLTLPYYVSFQWWKCQERFKDTASLPNKNSPGAPFPGILVSPDPPAGSCQDGNSQEIVMPSHALQGSVRVAVPVHLPEVAELPFEALLGELCSVPVTVWLRLHRAEHGMV